MKPFALFVLTFSAFAQMPLSEQPPLIACGTSGGVEIICGTHSPEDLEIAPGGKSLIVSEYTSEGGRLVLFDPPKKTFTPLVVTNDPQPDWGDKSCPGPLGKALFPHGTALGKRKDGRNVLLVVNHLGRESVEFYELVQSGEDLRVLWHGCVVSKQLFNDIAVLPDGGFVATQPLAIRAPGQDIMLGAPTGYTIVWTPAKGASELPGTRMGFPNGVVASKDGRYIYLASWTAKEIHKYDLGKNRNLGMVRLDFMPDNITWTPKGKLLVAGVRGARGECPAQSGRVCIQQFAVAEVDPAKMAGRSIFDSTGKGGLIPGASVALEFNGSIYVGAFQGDRILRFPRAK